MPFWLQSLDPKSVLASDGGEMGGALVAHVCHTMGAMPVSSSRFNDLKMGSTEIKPRRK